MKHLLRTSKIAFLFILLLFFTGSDKALFAQVHAPTFACPDWAMHEIDVPVNTNVNPATKFRFKFQWIKKTQGAPTIIFIPGGPGSGSISESAALDQERVIQETYQHLGIPETFNLILTDPRSVGCNSGFQFRDDDLSSDLFADDLLAMIRNTGLKDYILYGHSYGTALATRVSARASQGEAAEPLAVVLAGIIGKAYDTYEESSNSKIILQWEKLKSDLNQSALAAVKQRKLGGISIGLLDLAIFKGLNEGASIQTDGTFGSPLRDHLNLLGSDQESDRLQIQNYFDSLPASHPMHYFADHNRRLVKTVQCREIDAYDFRTELGSDGGIKIEGDNLCTGVSLDRPFDSAAWQIKSPIYYLAGLQDPSTPYSGAKYHFDNQKLSSKKFFITIPEGGHLMVSGALGDCKNSFWGSVSSEGKDMESALLNCLGRPKLEVQSRLQILNPFD